jgi:2,4-dienoyl-CoA reductase-like NADH-dependent reductase (Old Yellow Enzyme family)
MAHELLSPQWTLADALALALVLADEGVDVLDVSSGGNNAAQAIPASPFYQVDLAEKIKRVLEESGKGMLVAAVGRIADARTAERAVSEKGADLAFVATGFLRDANLVYRWAEELGVEVEWPRQYMRADRGAKMGTL